MLSLMRCSAATYDAANPWREKKHLVVRQQPRPTMFDGMVAAFLVVGCVPLGCADHSAETSSDPTNQAELTGNIRLGRLDNTFGEVYVVVALSHSPTIRDLAIKPSRFGSTCDPVLLHVIATDSDGDDLTYAWSVNTFGAIFYLSQSGPMARFAAETPMSYSLTVTVRDSTNQFTHLTFPLYIGQGAIATCDHDVDNDGWADVVDNCPRMANPIQGDRDTDGVGDLCDDDEQDTDGDGIPDHQDECPLDPDNDEDGDAVCGDVDNCCRTPNPDQADANGDGFGDACVSPLAEIDDRAIIGHCPQIGRWVDIDYEVTIGDRVEIASNVWLLPGVDIGDETRVGEGAILAAHAEVGQRGQIGRDAVVHARAEIGDDFIIGERSSVGTYAVLGNLIRIGADTTIFDYAELGDECEIHDHVYVGSSTIGPRCRLEGWSYVGHQSEVGADLIAERDAYIQNRVRVGDNIAMGVAAGIGDNTTIGSGTVLRAGADVRHGCILGKGNDIGSNVRIDQRVTTFDRVSVGANSRLWPGGVWGNDVVLGAACAVGAADVGDRNSFGDRCVIWSGAIAGTDNTFGSDVTLLGDADVGSNVTVGDEVLITGTVPDHSVLP